MSPRVLDVPNCPHCGAELPRPETKGKDPAAAHDALPRTCPACAGSLQKRYLASGCLTSKPLVWMLGGTLGWALARLYG